MTLKQFATLFLALLAGGANFVAFVIGAYILGGDAFNGKVVDGHYFVGSHGTLTEVSSALYNYSLCHAVSVFVTIPLIIVFGAVTMLQPPPPGEKIFLPLRRR